MTSIFIQISIFQVGTSLGATRGFLLRGGDVLEKFADVDAVVFDKTGTLTIGRPVVTKVIASRGREDVNTKLSVSYVLLWIYIVYLTALGLCFNISTFDFIFDYLSGVVSMNMIQQHAISKIFPWTIALFLWIMLYKLW